MSRDVGCRITVLLLLLLLDEGSVLLLLVLLQLVLLLLLAVEWLGGGGSLRLPDAEGVAEVGGNISNTLGGPMVDDSY